MCALGIAADSPEGTEDLQRKARPEGDAPEAMYYMCLLRSILKDSIQFLRVFFYRAYIAITFHIDLVNCGHILG